jgi:2,3-bisphosphoglycerate-independent phosphoglycerate mutase
LHTTEPRFHALTRSNTMQPPDGPVVLLILDGVGEGRKDVFDATAAAHTPVLDRLRESRLFRTLRAHGTAVGLPSDTDMGNSEVGHNTLGAGRIFDQGPKRIDNAIESGSIWTGTWPEIVHQVNDKHTSLHLIGLLSDGNVHSHMSHLYAIVDRAAADGINAVYIHVLLDGRDVPDRTADRYVAELTEHLKAIQDEYEFCYKIASGGGRMITTMDRYGADWSIVERGWQAHVLGTARPFDSALDAIETFRKENPNISDQLLPAFTICDSEGNAVGPVADGDAVIIFNFRGDRVIQLSQAFATDDSFRHFARVRSPEVLFAGITLYDSDLGVPAKHLVQFEQLQETLSEFLASTGVREFACAETQKFGHVTYFWNGNRSGKFNENTETYLEIPSDKIPFNQRPWMKSAETADEVIRSIKSGSYDFIRANFAGGDMVGHTGYFEPSRISVEAIDLAIGRILDVVTEARGCLIVTADHGNVEDMVERSKDGTPLSDGSGNAKWKTAHSLNPVPFIIVESSGRRYELKPDLDSAGLANVASTVVQLLGFDAPTEFEPSLISVRQSR